MTKDKTFKEIADPSVISRFTPLKLLNDRWEIGGVDCLELAENYGTPIFIIDSDTIKKNCRGIAEAFRNPKGDTEVRYAVKANNNLVILKKIKDAKFGVEVASEMELFAVLEAGFPANQILFNGNAKSEDQLRLAIKKRIEAVIVDCQDELEHLNAIAAELNSIVPYAIRVNLTISTGGTWDMAKASSKFGIPYAEVRNLYQHAHQNLANLEPIGLHCHLGSQIQEEEVFFTALDHIVRLFANICRDGSKLQFLDIGGGFPVSSLMWSDYLPVSSKAPTKKELIAEFDMPAFGKALIQRLNVLVETEGIPNPRLLIEPGRSIMMNSGILITKVQRVKGNATDETPGWIAVDAGCHTLQDCWIYDWFFECLPLNTNTYDSLVKTYNIAGPLCDSGDIIGYKRALPKIKRGDFIAFLQVGGYHSEMQSSFHLIPRAASVLVEHGKHRLIQPRELYASQNYFLERAI